MEVIFWVGVVICWLVIGCLVARQAYKNEMVVDEEAGWYVALWPFPLACWIITFICVLCYKSVIHAFSKASALWDWWLKH